MVSANARGYISDAHAKWLLRHYAISATSEIGAIVGPVESHALAGIRIVRLLDEPLFGWTREYFPRKYNSEVIKAADVFDGAEVEKRDVSLSRRDHLMTPSSLWEAQTVH